VPRDPVAEAAQLAEWEADDRETLSTILDGWLATLHGLMLPYVSGSTVTHCLDELHAIIVQCLEDLEAEPAQV
jgi:hypothetical protein